MPSPDHNLLIKTFYNKMFLSIIAFCRDSEIAPL